MRRRGGNAEAEREYRETLDIDTQRFGEEHVRTATTLNNLAAVLRAEGRLHEAEASARETMETRRRLLGEVDTPTRRVAQFIADMYADAGRKNDAAK